jgi:hypothetical protein
MIQAYTEQKIIIVSPNEICLLTLKGRSWDSVVGIATGYGLED